MRLDPLGETPHRFGATLHVSLHRLDDARGLARHHLAVLSDLLQDGVGERGVALVEVLERLGDVPLDLLKLVPDALDPVEGGGVGDLADRGDRGLDRLAGGAAGLGKVTERILHAPRTGGERLEALVARRDQAPDRLIPREEADDPLLFRTNVFRG